MFTIFFCADGVLRAKHREEPLIPITFIQKHSIKTDDFSFWSEWWKYNVHFESGLTLSGFFSCLEPWSKFFSTLTNVDIHLYSQEMKKPCAVEHTTRLKYLEICSETLLEPEMKFLGKLDIKELLANINAPTEDKKERLAQLTGLWKVNNRKSIHAFTDEDEKIYAFTLTHPESMANLPIVLNHQKIIYFSHHIVKRFINKEISIFNEELPSILTHNGQRDLMVHEVNYSLREVVEMFFSTLAKTPEDAREWEAHVVSRIKSSMEERDNKIKQNERDAINAKKIVSIHKDKDIPSTTFTKESKQKEVKFETSAGFLSDLSSIGNPEKQLWTHLLELAHKEDVVLRIGKVKEQIMPEIRLFGTITSPDNYIQPSKPKNI